MPTSNILIFVVDDEPFIHDLLETALQDGGFEVVTASSGEEAIKILESRFLEIRVLITDVNLVPNRLTGWDVGKRARELNADFPVIYMTGRAPSSGARKGCRTACF